MHKLDLDALQVDSFATAGEAPSAAIITGTVPYSLLGSCYSCIDCTTGSATITICPVPYTVAAEA
jgi:hypothetical protein